MSSTVQNLVATTCSEWVTGPLWHPHTARVQDLGTSGPQPLPGLLSMCPAVITRSFHGCCNKKPQFRGLKQHECISTQLCGSTSSRHSFRFLKSRVSLKCHKDSENALAERGGDGGCSGVQKKDMYPAGEPGRCWQVASARGLERWGARP